MRSDQLHTKHVVEANHEILLKDDDYFASGTNNKTLSNCANNINYCTRVSGLDLYNSHVGGRHIVGIALIEQKRAIIRKTRNWLWIPSTDLRSLLTSKHWQDTRKLQPSHQQFYCNACNSNLPLHTADATTILSWQTNSQGKTLYCTLSFAPRVLVILIP